MHSIEDFLKKRVLIKYPVKEGACHTEETGVLLEILEDGYLIEDKYKRLIFTPRNNAKIILLGEENG